MELTGKLGGICLISPFSSFDYNKKSYRENEKYDLLTQKQVDYFNSNVKPAGMSDAEAMKIPYLSPVDAPPGWWKNIPVDRIIILWGTREVFADDCKSFGKRLQDESGKTSDVKAIACDRECHDGAIVDCALNLDHRTMAKGILSWMAQFKQAVT